MTLDELNNLTKDAAYKAFQMCCTSEVWIEAMIQKRPYPNMNTLHRIAQQTWSELDESDYLEAFLGHPKIGDVNSLKAKFSQTKALASDEQKQVNLASETVLKELIEFNEKYTKKFGFIFIVYASGKSAEQMLEILKSRMENDYHKELNIAALEQSKITELRLNKLLNSCE